MSSLVQSSPEPSSSSEHSSSPDTSALRAPAKSSLAKNNAFGQHAPSWNLEFPNGPLTAVEIVVYCPHWLKSVDVITRFVNNGVKSVYLAAIINEHRDIPGDQGTIMVPNSTTVMMQYAMRRCGYDKWTLGTHNKWNHDDGWNHYNLDVGPFRTPRITHPKQPTQARAGRNDTLSCNAEAPPIPFKDLAIHVKKHPTGFDALDLTRCVLYAVAHPHEEWRFPTDFGALVKRLGGPVTITSSHYDHAAFSRRALQTFTTPRQTARGIRGPPRAPNPNLGRQRTNTGATKRSHSELVEEDDKEEGSLSTGAGCRTMSKTKPTPARKVAGSRRSARNLNKAVVYDEDKPAFTSHSDGSPAPAKKRRLSHSRPSKIDDEDYQSEDSNPSDGEIFAIDDLNTPDMGSLTTIEASSFSQLTPAKLPSARSKASKHNFDPELKSTVLRFEQLPPSRLEPPVLSGNPHKIDDINIHLYAAENCTSKDQLWATAMSSLQGPRRHYPFRPLADLTDPEPWDVSDWAENIRWAKSQKLHHGISSWTEESYHLELIKQQRLDAPWVSEEHIRACSETAQYKAPRGYVAPTTLPSPADWTSNPDFVHMHDADLRDQAWVEMNADVLRADGGSEDIGGLQGKLDGFVEGNRAQYAEHLEPSAAFSQGGGFTMLGGDLRESSPLVDLQQQGAFGYMGASQQAYGSPQSYVLPSAEDLSEPSAAQFMGGSSTAGVRQTGRENDPFASWNDDLR